MQRALDLFLSLIAIIILSPLLLLIIVILKFTGEGEIFYIQQRVGIGGRTFGVFKFATMVKNSSKIGTGFITTKNDPRVLPFGRFLRKTKLNEVPQLFNIVIGDMSFVGPRPQVRKHFEVFPEHVKKELVKIKPGLTGVGSIFFRDEESILENNKELSYDECYSQLIAPYKGELEIWYSKKRSVGLYLLLLIITGWVVIFPSSRIHMKVLKNLPQPPASLSF
jgi:lipopolysaccharide/colanic/teichoic acid biosynthesis glycosyltransferase